MFAAEEEEIVSALRGSGPVVVVGHSGHRLRLLHDSVPILAQRARVAAEALAPLLVSSPERLLRHLHCTSPGARLVLFVNTDLCDAGALRLCGLAGCSPVRLRALHHADPATDQLLHALERGVAPAPGGPLTAAPASDPRGALAIPARTPAAARVSLARNAVDAGLAAVAGGAVRCFAPAWTARGALGGAAVLEHTWPAAPAGSVAALRARAGGGVAVVGAAGAPRAAVVVGAGPGAAAEGRRVLRAARAAGWGLVAAAPGPAAAWAAQDSSEEGLRLWRGARVALGDGRTGVVSGFAPMPLVAMDGGDGCSALPVRAAARCEMDGLLVSELPLRYGDTVTAEELFLAPRTALERQRWVLRPSLFIGRLARMRCVIAAAPALSQITVTDPLSWKLFFAAERRR